MIESGWTTIRATVIVLVVVGMPLLAVPQVQTGILRGYRVVTEWAAPRSAVPSAESGDEPPRLLVSDGPVELTPTPSASSRAVRDSTRAVVPVSYEDQDVQVGRIQGRLRRLGAASMTLSTLDERPVRYFFHCRFPLPGAPMYYRPYEAYGANPLEAMQRVLDQVERPVSRVP